MRIPSPTRIVFIVAAPLLAPPAMAGDACAFLTTAEVEAAIGTKVTATLPSVTDVETGCVFTLGKDKVLLSYFTDPAKEPQVKNMNEDPFMRGATGPNSHDYGTVGCKVVDAGLLSSTNCNHYQPHWLHIAVQTRPPKAAASMDTAKDLLEKAAARFKR